MTGPSAIGSEKGMPNSHMPIPAGSARSMASRISPVLARSGSPAVMKGIRALPPCLRRPAKIASIRFMALSISGRGMASNSPGKWFAQGCQELMLAGLRRRGSGRRAAGEFEDDVAGDMVRIVLLAAAVVSQVRVDAIEEDVLVPDHHAQRLAIE